MSNLMMTNDELAFIDADYPSYYTHKMHPDDGKVSREPIQPETFLHRKVGHSRLFLRISFKLGENRFVPFTFVCDTGAPNYFYLSKVPRRILAPRIRSDETDVEYMYIGDRKTRVDETPMAHDGSNVIGLMMLSRLGMKFREADLLSKNYPNIFNKEIPTSLF